jgi:hypothetical protein
LAFAAIVKTLSVLIIVANSLRNSFYYLGNRSTRRPVPIPIAKLKGDLEDTFLELNAVVFPIVALDPQAVTFAPKGVGRKRWT